MKKIAVIALMLTGIYTKMSAQQPAIVVSDKTGWHKIAETKVDSKMEKDEVMVMGADRFATLVIKVTEAPVEIVSLDIYFEDETMQNVKVNKAFKTPGQTDVIDLKGEKDIKKIAFVYKTMANAADKKGHIEIWGKKTNMDKNNMGKNK